MDCAVAEKKINSFIKGTLKDNELRRVYYHLIDCDKCKDILLDEFSFYTAFNDLDSDLNYNYKKKLNEYMNLVESNIISTDQSLKYKYTLISIFICIFFVLLVAIALKVVYI